MLTIQNYNNHDTNATTPTIAGTKKCHNRHDCHYEYRHTTAMLQVQTLPLPLPVLLRPSTSSRSASPDPTTTTTEATTTTTAAIYYCFHHHYCRSLSLLRAYYQLQLLALLRRPPVRRCCSFNGLLLPCSLWLWSLLIVGQSSCAHSGLSGGGLGFQDVHSVHQGRHRQLDCRGLGNRGQYLW